MKTFSSPIQIFLSSFHIAQRPINLIFLLASFVVVQLRKAMIGWLLLNIKSNQPQKSTLTKSSFTRPEAKFFGLWHRIGNVCMFLTSVVFLFRKILSQGYSENKKVKVRNLERFMPTKEKKGKSEVFKPIFKEINQQRNADKAFGHSISQKLAKVVSIRFGRLPKIWKIIKIFSTSKSTKGGYKNMLICQRAVIPAGSRKWNSISQNDNLVSMEIQ